MTLLILGATGLVGAQALELALSDDRVARVVAPTRRRLPPHPKLLNPIIDYSDLPEADWWHADAALCALGTTLKQAGSPAAFRKVDFEYVVESAGLLHKAGCRHFVLVSSLGADAASGNFYLKVKGEAELALQALGFKALTVLRPSLLDGGPRPDKRPAETIGLWMAKHLGRLIPASYRPVSTRTVAHNMLEAAVTDAHGVRIIESAALHHSTG